jgi:hypothetical protein
MDRDFVSFDVFQNSIVRGGLPARVMFGRQAVDRDARVIGLIDFHSSGIGRTALVTS